MAITISSDMGTAISTADTTTSGGSWTKTGSTQNPGSDTKALVEGAGAINQKTAATTGATDTGAILPLTASFNCTNKVFYHWRNYTTPANMLTKANLGTSLFLSPDASYARTNFKQFALDGSDTDALGGWRCYAVDPSLTADASAGSFNVAAIRTLGFLHRQTAAVGTTVPNSFIDVMYAGTGLTGVASSSADTINFEAFRAYDNDPSRAYGVLTAVSGIFFAIGKLTIGATNQTNTCLFADTSKTLVWKQQIVADTFYEVIIQGASGFASTFRLGSKDGSNNVSAGCSIQVAGTAKWTLTCTTYGHALLYDTNIFSMRAATLSSGSELRGSSFTSCGTIDVNGATIVNCVFASHTATQLKMDATSDASSSSSLTFNSGGTGHAIELTAAGTYTFNNFNFNGYGANGTTDAAVYNNSGGAVTINVSSGNTPTVRNGSGASTTVNNSIVLTLTGLVVGSDIVILDAGTTTERVNIDANATSTYQFSFSLGGSVDICVYKKGYIPKVIRNYTLPSVNTSLPIDQVTDRNFLD